MACLGKAVSFLSEIAVADSESKGLSEAQSSGHGTNLGCHAVGWTAGVGEGCGVRSGGWACVRVWAA